MTRKLLMTTAIGAIALTPLISIDAAQAHGGGFGGGGFHGGAFMAAAFMAVFTAADLTAAVFSTGAFSAGTVVSPRATMETEVVT